MSSKIVNVSSGILISLLFLASTFFFSHSADGFIEQFKEFQRNGATIEIGFILGSANFWWLLTLLPMAGIFYAFKGLAKRAWAIYGISLSLAFLLYLLLVWSTYTPVHELKNAF